MYLKDLVKIINNPIHAALVYNKEGDKIGAISAGNDRNTVVCLGHPIEQQSVVLNEKIGYRKVIGIACSGGVLHIKTDDIQTFQEYRVAFVTCKKVFKNGKHTTARKGTPWLLKKYIKNGEYYLESGNTSVCGITPEMLKEYFDYTVPEETPSSGIEWYE